jgi:hypothetical protein
MKKLLARMHVIVGAVIVGPKFYGLAWPTWGIGVMIHMEEKSDRT